jgi:flavin-dependent dehydrogenase
MIDVLIAGGGPAGAVAARLLAAAGTSVTVADGGRRPGPRVGESLPPAARRILVELDLMHVVEGHLVCPGNVSAWGSGELEATDFVGNLDGPGWQVDRPRFDAALLDAAAAAGARVLRGTRVFDAGRDGDGWLVTCSDSARRCDFFVDATGRRARLTRSVGARTVRDDLQIAWICAYATAADDRDARTLIEAVADGWWYTSLVPGNRRVVGFVTLPHVPVDFAERLAATTHVAARVRGARLLDGPRATDASGTHLAPVAGPGWLAVGDAALAFDPLSSQGLFDALSTGMQGARAVLAGDVTKYTARVAAIRDAYRRQRAAVLARRAQPR